MLEDIFRESWGRVLASLAGFLGGDLDLAEEAASEAFAVAASRWPRDGVPESPVAWLVVVGRRAALDRIRRDRVLAAKVHVLGEEALVAERHDDFGFDVGDLDDAQIADERLELIFTCCHPALALEAQVALTLRALGGLSSEEIAAAFIVSDETMKRRLSRARVKIRESGIPFRVPEAGALPDRLDAVLAVVYLIFNQGWSFESASAGLAGEAIRLGRLLAGLMPDEPEVHGLVGLMLIQESRRAARIVAGAGGEELVLLGDQNRSAWDSSLIAEGRACVDRAVSLRGRGPYVLQAAIASLHCEEEIDWEEVALLYAALAKLTGSPVVELNRAVAVAEAGHVEEALALVSAVAGELDGYRYLHATHGELLRRLGRPGEAREALERALALGGGAEPERRLLERRLADL